MQSKVIDILQELSGINEIQENHSLQEDLGLDSLCMVTLLVELEEVYGFELDESDMNPFELFYVEDVLNLVDKYLEDSNETTS